jgi:pseudouridine-5'-phosphate glycosidase
MNPYLDIAPEVQTALAQGQAVVALESTIISHGMPFPQNVETALRVEAEVRAHGAVPATVAIVQGRLQAGLSSAQIERLGRAGHAVTKVSRRGMGFVVAAGADGATTVAATMRIAALAGIRVFATGGIGGVHRGAEQSFDISADLQELAQTPVAVVCAGAKSILDLRLTLEYLETQGVPVVGYQTQALPAFFTRESGFQVDYRLDSAQAIAAAMHAQWTLGLPGGMVVANPIPRRARHGAQHHRPRHRPSLARGYGARHQRQSQHAVFIGPRERTHRRRQPGIQYRFGAEQRPLGLRDCAGVCGIALRYAGVHAQALC